MPYDDFQLKAISDGLEAGLGIADIVVPPPKKKTAGKSQKRDEWKIQADVNKWWLASCDGFGLDPCLYYSVPNGFISQGKEEWQKKGSLIKAWMLKLAGLKSGIPDNVLAVMRFGFGALYIEFKTPDGVVSAEQDHVHRMLIRQGYLVNVCRSTEDAIKVITKYIT